MLDPDGRILCTNPAAQQRLGYAPDQLTGMDLVFGHVWPHRLKLPLALHQMRQPEGYFHGLLVVEARIHL